MNIEDITIAITCGGKATRLYPMTHEVPKALIPVGGKPVVQDMIEFCKTLGFRKFVLCEGHFAAQIQEYFGDGTKLGVQITHVVEPEPLGTAGCLKFAQVHLSDPFIVLQGDVLFRLDLRRMLEFHLRKKAIATTFGHKSSHPEDSDLLAVNQDWMVTRIFRPQAGEEFVNIGNGGVFIFTNKALQTLGEGKKGIEKDLLMSLLPSQQVYAYYSEDFVKDMGTHQRLEQVNTIVENLQRSKPAVFLDRDGVINEEIDLLANSDDLRIIPGSDQAIRVLNEQRIPVVVVTNQPQVARNLCTEDDIMNIHDRLQYYLVQQGAHIDRFYYCPHHPEKHHPEANDPKYRRECDCRKPNPGMLLLAAGDMNLDLSRSVIVGDKTSDLLAGSLAGTSTVLVQTGYGGKDAKHEVTPDHVAENLQSAVPHILKKVKPMNHDFKNKKVFVTGGAGFIGSHIVDWLVKEGAIVTIYDSFVTGQEEFIAHHNNVRFVRADVLDFETLVREMKDQYFVFHLQANADVRGGMRNTRIDLEQNTIATWNVCDAMRINQVKYIAFSSSAVMYGEPTVFPTPEDYMPVQTALYGASKLAGEAMIESYCEYFDMTCYIFRFVSWIGERYTHGVVFDFMKKLKANPHELEVLGDGKQRKSYLDVVDGVNGIFFAIQHAKEKKNIFNLGHDDFMNVLDLAAIVFDEMGLRNVKIKTTGGERGWVGDSPFVHLDTTKLKSLGWKPQVSIEQGLRNTVRYLKAHPKVFERRKIGET